MTFFTYCPGRKSFFVALSVMVCGLFILKFSNGNSCTASPLKNGHSVVVLKKVYSAFTKKSFTAVKAYPSTSATKALTAIQANTFKNAEKNRPSLEKYSLNISGIKN